MATDSSEQPFFEAPTDDALEAFNSIDTWPSLMNNANSLDELTVQSADQVFQAFCRMPSSVQKEFAEYPGIVKLGLTQYAESGDPRSSVEWIVRQIPSMLLRPDRTSYIPIEAALESGNGDAVRVLLDEAERAETLKRLLGYRNPRYRHTLLMLAVHLNSRECSDIFHRLMSFDPTSLHRCYDSEGRNVFHRCTEFGFSESFQIIFGLLIENDKIYKINFNEVKKALEMTDAKKWTPIHYICASAGNVELLKNLQTFLSHVNHVINFDSCFQGSNCLTPLMVAVQKGHFDVCKWLLENGSVDVHFKQHSTCLTALHFAVKAGSPELIDLLMKHGADFDFCDSDCDDLTGYKTPLDVALSEDIANREACIRCLRSGTSAKSVPEPCGALGDVTNSIQS